MSGFNRRPRLGGPVAATVATLGLLVGCGSEAPQGPPTTGSGGTGGSSASPVPRAAPTPAATEAPESRESPGSSADSAPTEEPGEQATADPGPASSDGTPRDARLSVPSLGLRDVEVVSYRGRTDDAAGTAIQNEGPAASPHGARGGTGPGGVGNYQVTAHRLSAGGTFRYLPDLDRGDRVRVVADGRAYVYEIRRTRITSFREPQSLREQRAEVPGRPGVEATRAMITLSTCRTLEDHAEGNYWSDEFDNPENRIDKIGVLVATRPA